MPSINAYLQIHRERRIRVNTCEGHVGVTDQHLQADRHRMKWVDVASVTLTRAQARMLAELLTSQMAKHF